MTVTHDDALRRSSDRGCAGAAVDPTWTRRRNGKHGSSATARRIVAAAMMALMVSGTVGFMRYDAPFDSEGNFIGPVMCPLALPSFDPGPPPRLWIFTGKRFWVPRWNLPPGDEVPFDVVSLSWTNGVQAVPAGQGWYKPSPRTTTYDGMTWTWTADFGDPAVLYKCEERSWLWGLFTSTLVTWNGQIWGHAFPGIEEGTGSGTRTTQPEGSSFIVCFEYSEYWYDSVGMYHEVVLDTWCEQVGGGGAT